MTDEELDRFEPVAEQFVQAVHRGQAPDWGNYTFQQLASVAVILASVVPNGVTLRNLRLVADLPASHELDDWSAEQLQVAHEEYERVPYNHSPVVVVGEMLFQKYMRAEVLQELSPSVDGLGVDDGVPA